MPRGRGCAKALFGALLLLFGGAHAATQTRTPGACASVAGIGTAAWSTAGNALTSNNSYASASVDGTTTNYLSCSNYGFTVPAGSRIDGITVSVERKSDRTSNGGSFDAAVRIVKGGAIGAADRSALGMYSIVDAVGTHGGATDLWGETWTATDVNAAGFGAAFAARKPDSNGPAHLITVDVISITVDYTPPPTVSSITRASANPTGAASVDWTVTFSEAVSGVDSSDFALVVTGLSGASISSVSGGPTTYTVTATLGYGVGTVGLNLADNDSITSVATAIALAGTGLSNGDFTGEVYSVNRPPPVANFNVVEPGANALTGRIHTKIAGQDIAVDIVALDSSNAVSTGFTGDVAVELVDNASGGACAGLPLIKALSNQTFVAADNGRHPLSAGQFEAEARRNVKFRIKYPVASPTITACSSDAFANRPASFINVLVRDQDRTTAGTTRTLSDTSNPGAFGSVVHNAGRPFQVDARTINGAGAPAVTSLYSPDAGQPKASVSRCGGATPPPACVAVPVGTTVTFGSWSAAAGAITSTNATYDRIGSFNLELVDETFSSVDDGDGTLDTVRHIRSDVPLTVGRFVPDYFAVGAPSSVTHRSSFAGCPDTFTYLGEPMSVRLTLTARNAAGAVLSDYDAAGLAAFDLFNDDAYNFRAIDATLPTPFSVDALGPPTDMPPPAWAAGSATVTIPIAIARPAAPGGPYTAMKIGIAPSDSDNVTVLADLDTDNNGTNDRARIPLPADPELRFGVLRLENAVGSERLDLPVPMVVQYWTGKTFQTNNADSCTSVTAANMSFSVPSYTGGLNAGNLPNAHITVGAPPGPGVLNLTILKPAYAPPSSAAPGTALLTVNLLAEGKTYLQGKWGGAATYNADPTSRAAFGYYGSQPRNFIYFRENY